MRSHISAPAAPPQRATASVTHDRTSFDPSSRYQVSPLDRLLADIAIRIQLSRTDYDKAVRRYKSISEWIERDGSPLVGLVELFYPQGSMAIGATIAARGTDEFDIDVVAQLLLAENVSPDIALDMVYEAIKGEQGSRYHRMTKRRTRCVTVEYQDGMHIDITPAVRRRGTPERESWIFHDRPGDPNEPSYRLVANPYGFAEWFKDCTPPDEPFSDFYVQRTAEYERALIAAEADAEPVPAQEPPFRKSKATIVLQLLKRWRNVQYEHRSGRRPPSIMKAKLVADAANQTEGLGEELLVQAEHLAREFQAAHDRQRLIMVTNPVCDQDVLTDRWPSSLHEQAIFLQDLKELVRKLKWLHEGRDLGEMKKIMTALFGEAPTDRVFSDYNENIGSTVIGGSRHLPKTGALVVRPTEAIGVGAATTAVRTASTPKHTFYGGE